MNTRAEQMEVTRSKLLAAAKVAFASHGYAGASMDDLCAAAGVTRGALYHNFGDKKGLLMAVVQQMDADIAARADATVCSIADDWDRFVAAGIAYIQLAQESDVQRIVLLDGPAVLGDPSAWPSQNACLRATTETIRALQQAERVRPVDPEAAARLLCGAAFDTALWVAASHNKDAVMAKAMHAFQVLAEGLLAQTS
ncbi:TetR/AcrR family transcriptional regulator [Roseobacter sp. CCS2]|uniref:TetR/AcrR family transcriptional regulator n=1 Tax=Roseobacter sp. CCS2 TaxID=391593 RepID=UPI0000F3E494|nr:TetR/AcrR family transcriptional regulator [Roseobacter sp. CCS2]EBA12336.1 probable transcriptional regulator protein, TetR family [Roseobacter sp. CCS2]